MHDVAIVGAGPAGIAVAYFLRDSGADVVVLEAGDDVGGRTLSVPVAGVPSNTGALFIYRGTPAEELATELGGPADRGRGCPGGVHGRRAAPRARARRRRDHHAGHQWWQRRRPEPTDANPVRPRLGRRRRVRA